LGVRACGGGSETDGRRFDELSRALATSASRRSVVKRLAGGIAGGLLGLLGVAPARAQDEDNVRVRVGDGGDADAAGRGGTVAGGDVVTGGNRGTTTTVGDTVGAAGGDATVVVDGGDVTHTTDVNVSADGGVATADASGGSGNTVEVVVGEPEPSAPPPDGPPPEPPPPPGPPPGVACAPTADSCGGSVVFCGGAGQVCSCYLPIDGSPSVCVQNATCSDCTDDAGCTRYGPGAFCAKGTGPNCTCPGGNVCAVPCQPSPPPGTCGPNDDSCGGSVVFCGPPGTTCGCYLPVGGGPSVCVENATCSDCASNADCPLGAICAHGTGPNCTCPGGNVCAFPCGTTPGP
jgi:hypothetical protein